MPSLTIAPVTESTRKGMSSVTTWMIVRGFDQPSVSVLGLYTRTFATPAGRLSASSRWLWAAPAYTSGPREVSSSSGTCRK